MGVLIQAVWTNATLVQYFSFFLVSCKLNIIGIRFVFLIYKLKLIIQLSIKILDITLFNQQQNLEQILNTYKTKKKSL